MMPPASDLVTVGVTVPTDPATAFAIFTKETDLWWRSAEVSHRGKTARSIAVPSSRCLFR